jgi:hypothetical protein
MWILTLFVMIYLSHEVVVESYSGDVLETEISAVKKTNLR